MPDHDVVAVVLFRRTKGKYHFYLTKKGSNLPLFPSSWSLVGSVILPEDREVFSKLQNQHGEMSPNMLKCITALRIVFERNLLRIGDLIDQDSYSDVYDLIGKINPEILSVWLHSMIPCGYQKMTDNEYTFHVNYILFITPIHPTLYRMRLQKIPDVYQAKDFVVEEKARWIESSKIYRNYQKLHHLVSPLFISLIEKIHVEYKNLIDAARELESQKIKTLFDIHRVFPYTWKFTTPTPDPQPYNTSNIYVVGNEHKYIIDPGSTNKKSLSSLKQFVEKNLDTIEGILLTNTYPDHCNQALNLKEEYGLPLCASYIAAKQLKKEGFTFTSTLKEGIKISLGSYDPMNLENWQMEVLELPGSSKGSIGFWDQRGMLFSGIALHESITTSSSSYPEAWSDFLDSINKLKKIPAKYVLSAHGNIIVDKRKSIKETIEKMKQIEKFVITQLKNGHTNVDELLELFYMEFTPQWKTYEKRLILSNLEKLASEKRVTKIRDDYVWNIKKNDF